MSDAEARVLHSRTCWASNGRRKRAFTSRREAKDFAPKGAVPYPCAVHGWHIGHERKVARGVDPDAKFPDVAMRA